MNVRKFFINDAKNKASICYTDTLFLLDIFKLLIPNNTGIKTIIQTLLLIL